MKKLSTFLLALILMGIQNCGAGIEIFLGSLTNQIKHAYIHLTECIPI